MTGWWTYYYPVALAVKVPLAFWPWPWARGMLRRPADREDREWFLPVVHRRVPAGGDAGLEAELRLSATCCRWRGPGDRLGLGPGDGGQAVGVARRPWGWPAWRTGVGDRSTPTSCPTSTSWPAARSAAGRSFPTPTSTGARGPGPSPGSSGAGPSSATSPLLLRRHRPGPVRDRRPTDRSSTPPFPPDALPAKGSRSTPDTSPSRPRSSGAPGRRRATRFRDLEQSHSRRLHGRLDHRDLPGVRPAGVRSSPQNRSRPRVSRSSRLSAVRAIRWTRPAESIGEPCRRPACSGSRRSILRPGGS